MIEKDNTINGKFVGKFYELDDGRRLYLAHKTPRQAIGKKLAWGVDNYTLRQCEARNIQAVGVVVRSGKRKLFYLTKREDFFDPAMSFSHFSKQAVERAIPSKLFRINPGSDAESILERASIGR